MKLHELEQARKAQAQSDKHVYFDESGNIVYYGRTESDEYVDSNHAVLSYDQCMIIEDSSNKTTNDFIIIVDPTTEGVYTLVNKQIELETFKSATKMLSLIKKTKAPTSAYDIKIEYNPAEATENLTVSLNEKIRNNVMKNMDVNNFTFKGANFINLYFTTEKDPHFMFDTIKVDLVNLFKDGKQDFSISTELSGCDLFTKKIFDKYEYRIKT
jgi:hypothetical protein|tara:strand:- start:1494 stop:2132 length:639 start_codon:yes stop_codon:yes gene_type:complete